MTELLNRVAAADPGDLLLATSVRAQAMGWRLQARLRPEAGQTTTEYLIIGGVAVIIALGIASIFSDGVKTGTTNLVKKVTDFLKLGG